MSTSQHPSRPYARPFYPHPEASSTSSQSSSAYPSYSSTSSFASTTSRSSAPLPSPSATTPQQPDFFGSFSRSQQQQSQRQVQGSQRHPTLEYQPHRDGAGRTAAETTSYLSQAALLAEAAKRAQMAVVMRDLDSMEL